VGAGVVFPKFMALAEIPNRRSFDLAQDDGSLTTLFFDRNFRDEP
jgi:hypothetical protein